MLKFILILASLTLLTSCGKPEQKDTKNCYDVPLSPSWSVYDPTFGTRDYDKVIGKTPCKAEVEGSLDRPMFIASDLGGYVIQVTNEGTEILYQGRSTNDLKRISSNELQFVDADYLVVYNLDSKTYTKTALGRWLRCSTPDLECRSEGVYLKASGVLIPAEYPRSALMHNGFVYVADTFGHKVVKYDVANQTSISIDVYYPNSLHLDNGLLYVTEEHMNRIITVDADNLSKSLFFACQASPFYSDMSVSIADIHAEESSGRLTQNQAGICLGDLLSPNHFLLNADGGFTVADCDNHQVRVYDSNKNLLTTVKNLNTPTRVIY